MKTVMKKLLSLMLVAVLLVSAVPFQASATETETTAATTEVAEAAATTYTVLVNVKLSDAEGIAETIKIENILAGQVLFLDRITYREGYEFAGILGMSSTSPAYTVSHDMELTVLLEKTPEETTAPTTAATEAPTTAATEAPTTAATEAPTTAPAQDDDVVVGTNYITLVLDLNYEDSVDKYIKTLDPDDKMGVILESVTDPTREGYSFAGWYWDDDYDYKVKDNEYIGGKAGDYIRIYAKWTRKSSANNVFLKIYLNGKTSSAAKIVDISSYGDADGMIDIYEARRVVGNYYTAKDSAGLSYDGLFTDATWNRGAYNNSDESNSVNVNADDDTYVYIMVYNAKTTTSSSTTTTTTTGGTADTTNPKTGDQIFMAVTMMSVSATALALFFFLNKKRAAK